MKLSTHLLILITIFSTPALSQPDCLDSISLKGNWFSGVYYKIGGSEYKKFVRSTGQSIELYALLGQDTLSRLNADKSNKVSTIGFWGCAVTAGILTAVAVYMMNKGQNPTPYFAGLIVPIGVGLAFDYNSLKRFEWAVRTYNQDTRPRRCK
jgi:hypothetical protein